jgi:hypothetical protein
VQARLGEGRQPRARPTASPGERADAKLKTWRILRKLRCCPWQAGQLAKAIHVLQARESVSKLGPKLVRQSFERGEAVDDLHRLHADGD